VRGPTQKEVWEVAKAIAQALESARPALITAEYRVARRPAGRVLVDYNQNAWGRTLASLYSVRPRPSATVSTPVTWREIERGVHIDDFRIDNVSKLLDSGLRHPEWPRDFFRCLPERLRMSFSENRCPLFRDMR
jgi:DNA primase